MILVEGPDAVVGETGGVGRVVSVVGEFSGFRIQPVETAVGAHPHDPGTVDQESVDVIIRQRGGVGRIVSKVLNGTGFRVETVDPGVSGPDPNRAVVRDRESSEEVARQASGLIGCVAVDDKGVGPVILSPNCTNCGRCIDVCSKKVFTFSTRFNNSTPDGVMRRTEVAS